MVYIKCISYYIIHYNKTTTTKYSSTKNTFLIRKIQFNSQIAKKKEVLCTVLVSLAAGEIYLSTFSLFPVLCDRTFHHASCISSMLLLSPFAFVTGFIMMANFASIKERPIITQLQFNLNTFFLYRVKPVHSSYDITVLTYEAYHAMDSSFACDSNISQTC